MAWPASDDLETPAPFSRLDFDVVLDEWPSGAQGAALDSLARSGDIITVLLPNGFVGVKILPTQILVYVESGRMHVKQVLPALRPVTAA